MKKILCVIDSLGSGGAQRQLVTLAKLLKQRGYEIRFLTYHPSDFFLRDLSDSGIQTEILNVASYWKRIVKIRKYIRRGEQDVVISFLDTPNFLSCFAAAGGKKWKLIISERSNKENYFKSWKSKIQKYFARYADAIVCNSVSAQRVWEKYYPSYKARLTTIYNTVLLPPIQNHYVPLRNGKFHLLVAASYRYLKNTNGLIEGINLLTEEEKAKLEIHWYGNKKDGGSDCAAYKEACLKIEAYKLKGIIYLHDVTQNIHQLMSEADAVGLFSHWEGLPNTICEAMKLSKPVVMSRVSDYSVLVNATNGFLCHSNDPSSICEAIRHLLFMSPEELREMGRASQAKAKEFFDNEVILEKWIQLFKA